MLKKQIIHRLLPVLCAVILLVCSAVTPAYAETAAERYKRLKEELAAISEQIDAYKENKAAAEQLRAALIEQKAYYEELIRLNQEQIAETQTALDIKIDEVAVKRQEIYDNDQLYRQRLLAMYKMNNTTALAAALNVDSFTDFFLVVKSLQLVAEHDTALLATLEQQQLELEAQQAEINGMLDELNTYYAELAAISEELAINIQTQNAQISAAEAAIAAQEEAYDATYEEYEKAYQEMLAATRNIGGSTYGDGSIYVGGVFIWPVPNQFSISCYYGAPDPNGRGHLGLDIRAPSGSTIVAAGDGRVITAASHSSYGLYIVVDHGNGTKTLYAHCSALWVVPGEEVSQGEGIAAVGSTGFSTGPHLHFEVHAQGSRQNPLNYLH